MNNNEKFIVLSTTNAHEYEYFYNHWLGESINDLMLDLSKKININKSNQLLQIYGEVKYLNVGPPPDYKIIDDIIID